MASTWLTSSCDLSKTLEGGWTQWPLTPDPNPVPLDYQKPWSKREDIKILFASKYFVLHKSLICDFFVYKVWKNGQQKRATCFATLLQIEFKSNVARLPATNQTSLATNQLVVAGFEVSVLSIFFTLILRHLVISQLYKTKTTWFHLITVVLL